MRLVYVVGPPGAGKSSALAAATDNWATVPNPWPTAVPTMAYVDRTDGQVVGLELGLRRAQFSGTDALSMSINPVACQWIGQQPHALVVGEGMRLANRRFFGAALAAGYALTLIALDASSPVLDDRCSSRGSQQAQSWRKGAATKASNITAWGDAHCRVIRIDTAQPLAKVALTIRRALEGGT